MIVSQLFGKRRDAEGLAALGLFQCRLLDHRKDVVTVRRHAPFAIATMKLALPLELENGLLAHGSTSESRRCRADNRTSLYTEDVRPPSSGTERVPRRSREDIDVRPSGLTCPPLHTGYQPPPRRRRALTCRLANLLHCAL